MDITLAVITLLSLVVAGVMSLISWRLVRDERARSAARVSALADDIRHAQDAGDLPLRNEGAAAVSLHAEMFAAPQAAPEHSRLALVATIVLAIGAVISVAIVFGVFGDSALGLRVAEGRAPVVPVVIDDTAKAAPAAAPLELVALGHERDPDGLVVRGVLRNPSNGAEVNALTAVVLLFNRDGGLVTSGRAAVQAPRLEPGGETTFVVTVPGAVDVERYRVSFRSEDHVVPHVDHRS